MPRQIEPRQGTDYAVDELASPEEEKCGSGVDPVLGLGEAVLIDVHQDELYPSPIDCSQLIENRSQPLAMAAKGRVEFRKHRPLEPKDLPCKGSIRSRDGMIGK